jgi:hypothetical protein
VCHTAEVKYASIKVHIKHDGFPYQKYEKILMFRLLLKEQLAQNSQPDVAGAGAKELGAAT